MFLGKMLGAGSFGKVYLGLNPVTGELMAVKQVELIENDTRNRKMVDSLQQEISLLRVCNN